MSANGQKTAGGEVQPGTQPHLRVMSYNIRAGIGADKPWVNLHFDRLDLEPVAAVIAAEAPDLVALQEIVVLEIDGKASDEAAFLAEQLGMYHSFGVVRDFPVIQNGVHVGDGLWGNAILSRSPITASCTHTLSNFDGLEPRAILETRIDCAGCLFTVFSTHLSFRTGETVRQAREVAAIARPAMGKGEVIVAGDFNSPANDGRLSALRSDFQDSFTVWGAPAEDPCRYSFPYGRRRVTDLDHVFVSPSLSIAHCWVVEDETGASDHNPVVAEVRCI